MNLQIKRAKSHVENNSYLIFASVISNMIHIWQRPPSERTQSWVNAKVLLRESVHLEKKKKNHTRKKSNARHPKERKAEEKAGKLSNCIFVWLRKNRKEY